MAKWLDVGSVADFPAGGHACLTVAAARLVIFHVGGQFYALENSCPHAGLPLGEGERCGTTITCPFHGYTYDIRTGRNVDFPNDEFPVRTFPARRQGDRVEVDFAPAPEPN